MNKIDLKNYADINGINDQRWQLLTSELSSIKSLKRGGFMLFADELPQGHAIKFILIDENGNIRKKFDGNNKASLEILKKGKLLPSGIFSIINNSQDIPIEQLALKNKLFLAY